MARETSVLISFKKPAGVSAVELRNFIILALETSGGCRHPDDPLFNSLRDVRVSKPITPWRDPSLPKQRASDNVTPFSRGDRHGA